MYKETIPLSDALQEALTRANNLAMAMRHAEVKPQHLMHSLLNGSYGINEILMSLEKDASYVHDWVDMHLEMAEKSLRPGAVSESPDIYKIIDEAEVVKAKLGFDKVEPLCAFVAAITPGVCFSINQLATLPIGEQDIYQLYVGTVPKKLQKNGNGLLQAAKAEMAFDSMPYCQLVDLQYEEEDAIKILGRDKEVRLLAENLVKFGQHHILVLGESGIGKTALLHSLLDHLRTPDAPAILKDRTYFQVNMSDLLSNNKYGNEVEERIGKIVKFLEQKEDPVLIIDDLHLLVGHQQSKNNLLSFLISTLSNCSFTLLATMQVEEYKKQFEGKVGFGRLFEIIQLENLDVESCVKCMSSHVARMEAYHHLKVDGKAVEEAVALTTRYLKEQHLPDSAIRLVDQTLSAVVLMNQNTAHILKEAEVALASIESDETSDPSTKLKELKWLLQQLEGKLSPVLLGRLEKVIDKKDDHYDTFLVGMRTMLEEIEKHAKVVKSEVSDLDIAAIIAHKTNIPIGKIRTEEKTKLMEIDVRLKSRVVGQDHAIQSLADAIIESRSGLKDPRKPIGSFFFLGPTGTGKTELAKSLAEFLFDDERAMIRFDMSEFKEEHSAALLYGAPPGYVGYEEGGLLVNQIRKCPYSVVLFDEIEKAHSSVYDIFLQIMDEGHIHDRLGKEGSFSNSIVLFTSNLGAEWVGEQFRKQQIPTHAQLSEIMSRNFRPEFLGRITEIIPFAPITEENVKKIFDIQMRQLREQLKGKKISLDIGEAARAHLAMSGYSEKYGARPIASVIRSLVKRPISRMLLKGEVLEGDSIYLGLDEGNNVSWSVTTP
jgi:ATP-dependent Clp protease ATP-binding subunit ClpB